MLSPQCTKLGIVSFPMHFVRHRTSVAKISEDLLQYMHGRARSERIDSVTTEILQERKRHLSRLENFEVTANLKKELLGLGLGSKKKLANVFSKISEKATYNDGNKDMKLNVTAAGGHATHIASAVATTTEDWPLFTHLLPEVAFAGHSNSGKSTLTNAMVGVEPRKGPASVSDRAGWTDQVCFYQLGKRPPKLTLADLPGYGHAVATSKEIKFWKVTTQSYLKDRLNLSCCCVLVDCTRGLCRGDKLLLKFIRDKGLQWHIVLTKADLLSVSELAQSVLAVRQDTMKIFYRKPKNVKVITEDGNDGEDQEGVIEEEQDQHDGEEDKATIQNESVQEMLSFISPVSAKTGAGIKSFWIKLNKWVDADTVVNSISPTAVKEHKYANIMRRNRAISLNNPKAKRR
jgi:ribosome biogenesis GTP-binding protein YsxC/EngB